MLRCSSCQKTFELQKEFVQCPECGRGVLVYKASDLESEIRAQFEELNNALESFGVTQQDYEEAGLDLPDDFYNSGYIDESEFHQPNLNDIIPELPEHPNCHCSLPHDKTDLDDLDNLEVSELSFSDTETHEFMVQTFSSLRESELYFEKMFNRFTRTFEKDATVPVGQRNS